MIEVSGQRFEALVGDALDAVPAPLMAMLSNVVVLVEDDPPADGPVLFGLYEGIPLTARDSGYAGVLPDRVTIYRRPVLAFATSDADVVEQVRATVVHEIAHHFGISDERLHELDAY